MTELDRADREPTLVGEARVSRLKEKMEAAKAHVQKLREIGDQLQKIPDKQISLTDPDARSMATSGRGTGIVGYNLQTAVETEHHLIVAHEVTNVGHDHHLLHKMATAAREALGTKGLTTIADRGYFKGEEILACEEQGIATLVPKPQTSSNRATGLFDKRDFRYIPETDEYACPAGQRAIWRFSCVEDGQTIHKYWSSACVRCSIKSRCTTGVYRRISRWEHEAVLERMQQRLDRTPDAMPIRRRTVEHGYAPMATCNAGGSTQMDRQPHPGHSSWKSVRVACTRADYIQMGTHSAGDPTRMDKAHRGLVASSRSVRDTCIPVGCVPTAA